ncbi:MAG: hypothetical protein N2645_06825 [Clostridia bacterium]|nr:hypothetical protein [Clostridia bacterium]
MVDWLLGKLVDLISDLIGGLFNIIGNVLMFIINTILRFLITILDKLLPSIGLTDDFMAKLDSAISTIMELINSVAFFIPIDIFVLCLTTVLIVDNSALIMRIGQWILKLIRG